MTSEYMELEVFPASPRWWALLIRGLAAIAFGVLAFAQPSISLFALVILWGAYAIVDGVFAVVVAIRGARVVPGRGWLLAEGIVSIASGVVTYLWPGITAVLLLAMIAVWAALTGIAEIVTAIRLRRQVHGEWILGLIGLYAILFGGLLVGLGFRLHRWQVIAPHHPSPEHAATRA